MGYFAPAAVPVAGANSNFSVNAELQGGSDARSGLGDFGDRDGLNRVGRSPDVQSGLSGLPA